MRNRIAVAAALFFLAASLAQGQTTQPATSLFDPARHMHVSEVHAGMKGYGLTVFSGTKIEKFNVEVVDVVHDFNPKYDMVLIRCDDAYLEHTGAIAGMSGSPIYLYDDAGKARMIGAFAYGWPMAKDPLAGVQPIEYMLSLPANNPSKSTSTDHVAGDIDRRGDAAAGAKGQSVLPGSHPHWSLDDVPIKPWGSTKSAAIENPRRYTAMLGGQPIQLQPLATPLMATGMSERMLKQIGPIFAGTGLMPMQAGGAGASVRANIDPKFEPGSVLGVPLLTGDEELTAIGTCTEVIGDRMFGFGHPFNSEGPISLPMGSGGISTVVANIETSFKMGYLSKPLGTLTTDQTVGVSGTIGRVAKMIPIEVTIVYDDKSVSETYHFQSASSKRFTPLIAATAVSSALTGEKELPPDCTVDYDMSLNFENGQAIHVVNRSVGVATEEVMNDVELPLMAASTNPFQQEQLTKLTGTIHISDQNLAAQIHSVMVPRSKYEPGETVRAFITYLPFHKEEATLPVEMDLPKDLKNGTYQLTVVDAQHYLEDERMAHPFEFTADNIDELFTAIKDVMGIRRDAVYLRLVRQADGVAVGRVAMPRLPSSQRQELSDSGRSDITPFISSTVKIVPTNLVMSGAAAFTITVEKHGKVEVAPKPTGTGGTPSDSGKTDSGKTDNSKPSAGKTESGKN